jgi:hypothetical protein
MSSISSKQNDEDTRVPACVRFQEAFEMYNSTIIPTHAGAATVAEMARSTFTHRALGRRSAEEYQQSRQLLNSAEEGILLWHCDILQRAGFPMNVKDVTALAETILRKRDPTGTVSPRWLDRCFFKRHPEVKVRWSQQLDRIRATHGNNFAAIELFFQIV